MHHPSDGLLPASDPLAHFFNHAPDATLLIAPGSPTSAPLIVACNPPACRLYGYTAPDLVGQPVTRLDGWRGPGTLADAVRQAQAAGALRCELVQQGNAGTYLEVDLALTPVAHPAGPRLLAIARDITAFKRTERRLRVQHAISSVLADAAHFLDAAPQLLQIIGETLGWEVGTLWCVDPDAGVLRWTCGWQAPDAPVAAFVAASRACTFAPGVGLPGTVWMQGTPSWISPLDQAGSVLRHASAAPATLRSAFALPIHGHGGVFGVMEFLSRGAWPADAELLALAASIGSQSGAFIERRRAEAATRFQAHLLDTVEQAVIATDLAGRITFWNRFAAQLSGWPAAETVGRPIGDVLPALQADATTILAHVQTGASWTQDVRGQRRDGSTFPAQVTASPVYDAHGALVGIVGVATDISSHKRSEARLHFLADASALLVSALDATTTLDTLTRLAVPQIADWCSITLIEADDPVMPVAGRHANPTTEARLNALRQQYPPPVAYLRALLAAAPTRTRLISDVTEAILAVYAPNPAQRQVYQEIGVRSVMLVPLRVGERLVGVILLATDESGRRYGPDDVALADELAGRAALALDNARRYAEAQAAIRTREDFLAIAAHELKTPLTSLIGYTQLLQRRAASDATTSARDRQALQVLGAQADRLATLVGALLDVSRIETGHFRLECQPLDLAALVRQTVEALQPTLAQHTLQYHGPEAPLVLAGDALRLEQVVQNLLQNAIKYSPAGGPIVVALTQQADQAILTISDPGIGIPAAAQAHLFERFYRAANAEQASSGVGIGLYVVKEIVSRHHGTVDVTSVEGQGSTFTVRLPLGAARVPAAGAVEDEATT